MPSFHEVRFPTSISCGASGGPERRTEIVVLGSGFEERNTRWAHSRRRYNAGYGVKSLDDIEEVVGFFEARRGRLHGFRWRDHADYKSCLPRATISPFDQKLGLGDGVRTGFQLRKTYGACTPYRRDIRKPVAGTLRLAVGTNVMEEGMHFTLDETTGVVTFRPDVVPDDGSTISAGFEFDTPVRFDTDILEIALVGFGAGQVPEIPVVEVRV